MEEEKIVRNRIRCTRCGDIVESEFPGHIVGCWCGACAADGGRKKLIRCWRKGIKYGELSEFEEGTSKK